MIERRGWQLLRISRSHHIYGKAGSVVRLSVPIHGNRPLKTGLLRHLAKLADIPDELVARMSEATCEVMAGEIDSGYRFAHLGCIAYTATTSTSPNPATENTACSPGLIDIVAMTLPVITTMPVLRPRPRSAR